MSAQAEPRLLLRRDVEVEGDVCDVVVEHGLVVAITSRGLGSHGDIVIDGQGGALIPGLHDHHIHLMALTAARGSLTFSTSFGFDVMRLDRDLERGEWVRCIGYHESVLGEMTRDTLDRLLPHRPLRVQHQTGTLWVLNSVALDQLQIDSADGRLFGSDDQLRTRWPAPRLDVAAVGRELAGYGVTGVTDLTPLATAAEVDDLLRSTSGREFPVHVLVSGGAAVADAPIDALRRGPVKVVIGDHQLPSIDELVSAFESARRAGRNVAVHCVTRVALVLALAAWEEIGAVEGDRVEHGAVIPTELIEPLRSFGLCVVTQPSFVHARGDRYLRDVEAEDTSHLWRCGSLIDAGIRVGGGTDAPFGDPDPWRSIAAAIDRLTAAGVPLGPAERVPPGRALALFLTAPAAPGGPQRRVEVGSPAELCLLAQPLADVLRNPTSEAVVATVGRAGLNLL